ncbi:Uncharacterized protein FWK35_00020675, partial [Aphis craccivora]
MGGRSPPSPLRDAPALSSSQHIFMDGTFATCPQDFFQVYVVHAQIGENMITIDFEQAVIKAIEDVFKNEVTIQLCYFHLNQSIWRKVQELGLAIKYKENKQFRQAVKLISALAFLP